MERIRDYERLLEGSYDMHVHAYPDMSLDNGGFTQSMRTVCEGYRQYGMAGFVLKTHGFPAPALANFLDSEYDDLEVMGSICMNSYAGGPYPYVAEMAAEVGCKMIWLPTVTSYNEYVNPGMRTLIHNGEWLPLLDNLDQSFFTKILDDRGDLLPNIKGVLDICKERHMIVATGHNSAEESLAVARYAKEIGIKSLVLTHAHCCCSFNTIEQMKAIAEMGYAVEMCTVELDPYFVDTTLEEMKMIIETVGPDHFVLSSDWYMGWRKNAAEDLMKTLSQLHFYGVKYDDLETLMKTPVRLVENR